MPWVLLLIPIVVWMAWLTDNPQPLAPAVWKLAIFFGGYVCLIGALGILSRVVAPRIVSGERHRRYSRWVRMARGFLPVWFGVGVFALDWGNAVTHLLGSGRPGGSELLGTLVAIAPAILAWMAMWWAQYPADRAVREHALLAQLDENFPAHPPPAFRDYFSSNFRLQILFIGVPMMLLLLVRDLTAMSFQLFSASDAQRSIIAAVAMLGSTGAILIFAPEILRRVLQTNALPPTPLRARLEQICARHNLRCADILLWHTHYNLGNAAVMGLIPRFRYILLSDLLVETMTDEQIEAVFAHEVGHVVHRHMLWYIVLFVMMAMVTSGPAALARLLMQNWEVPQWASPELFMTLAGLAFFLICFGYLSRRFERQADVFAARTLEGGDASHVGTRGAMTFLSALHRVATINQIPLEQRSWCHGSIAKRMHYVRALSEDPSHTEKFDRVMMRIRQMLLMLLVVGVLEIFLLHQFGLFEGL